MFKRKLSVLSFALAAIFALGIFTVLVAPQSTSAKKGIQRGNVISKEQAKTTAVQKAGQGTIVKCKLDRDDGRIEYEVVIVNGDIKHEIDIDAYTNTVLKHEREQITKMRSTLTPDMISPDKAKQIALARTNGTITECTLEYEDDYRTVVYEIDVVSGTTKYEYDIDAKTGRILKQKTDIDYGIDDII